MLLRVFISCTVSLLLQVVFHNTNARRARVPLLTDFWGFDIAALGPLGAFYAAPPGAEDAGDTTSTAVLCYRMFSHWASNSDWTLRLAEGERALCIAAGWRLIRVRAAS